MRGGATRVASGPPLLLVDESPACRHRPIRCRHLRAGDHRKHGARDAGQLTIDLLRRSPVRPWRSMSWSGPQGRHPRRCAPITGRFRHRFRPSRTSAEFARRWSRTMGIVVRMLHPGCRTREMPGRHRPSQGSSGDGQRLLDGARSTPMTFPPEPTRLRAGNDTSPPPQPTSSTLIPGTMPATRNSRSVRSPNQRPWSMSRSISLGVWPGAY
jgi:hypothetical protein